MTEVDYIFPRTGGKVAPGVLTQVSAGVLVYADGVNLKPNGITKPGWYMWTGSSYLRIATSTPDYDSGEQTITSAGALTLAHGLGVAPSSIQVFLICKTAEQGYSIGQKIPVYFGNEINTSPDRGVAAVVDATNILVRFGSSANVFDYLNFTTGNVVSLTNANWKAIFRVWI